MSVVCCQVEVSASGRSLFESSPTECSVTSECDREAPYGKALARNRAEAPQKRNIYIYMGTAVVKVLCYKSEGRWFDPSWCQ